MSNISEQPANQPMDEYQQLKQNLLITTLVITSIIFVTVWVSYSLKTGLSYLLGSCVGIAYLRMLAKNVEGLGVTTSRLSSTRLALFAALIIVATQWRQLEVIPVFLGFVTYKAALIIYVLQTSFMPLNK